MLRNLWSKGDRLFFRQIKEIGTACTPQGTWEPAIAPNCGFTSAANDATNFDRSSKRKPAAEESEEPALPELDSESTIGWTLPRLVRMLRYIQVRPLVDRCPLPSRLLRRRNDQPELPDHPGLVVRGSTRKVLDSGEINGENMARLRRAYGEKIYPRTCRLASIHLGFKNYCPFAL
jgi:hypothetical protein